MKVTLCRKFPGKAFDSGLLHWIKVQTLDEQFGKDRHRVPEILRNGKALKRKGGVWEPIMCPDTLCLKGTHFQTLLMKEYADEYGQYIMAQGYGTHNTNKYGITSVVWTNINSLGLSTNCGLSTMLYEEKVSIEKSAQLFGLSRTCLTCNKNEEGGSSIGLGIRIMTGPLAVTIVPFPFSLVVGDRIFFYGGTST
eukprot:scaffold161999_cov90-Attheya_sp.AAC.2